MIWLALLLLAGAALSPLAFSLLRQGRLRGRQQATLALYRAQIAELERERAEGRLAEREHASALLEVERRLLAAADRPDAAPAGASRLPLLLALVLIPAAGLALYLPSASPYLPAAPIAGRIAAARARMIQSERLAAVLKAKLATMDPRAARTREGYILLGKTELDIGDLAAAARAWRHALAAGFDPTLAVDTAEAETRASGHVTRAAAALFQRALAEGAANAPWRPLALARLAQARHR